MKWNWDMPVYLFVCNYISGQEPHAAGARELVPKVTGRTRAISGWSFDDK